MKLGAFSLSLAVNDLSASKEFYTKIGFEIFAGSEAQKYLIMKNGDALIGLFEGMFENNIITFNPGWNQNAETQMKFDDIRSIQKDFKSNGLTLLTEADPGSKGPANFLIKDPDGNIILIDQHV
ncbi:VOC family protein [Robertkochia solimangrovi]|uniref:VOC family protein n=1 Tax=Robertkochia solimangrovi TaxID=2213046 RepID=UPI00117CF37C|nr:VOC family protein [Robertkochia solimangrovi]TRZ45745.1 VOC family protein [Robertkochia solimangrovi]